ncbi:hypothetical protein CgunFtcFv8_020193 [Champsocephalus gunnari]|uniref:Uncharacterized protein n=1 Tax=Champsocephalus gunnari TaxID=52237 RepID=A0AAN8DGW3_CHAGU|nr:hypothetical protein CgunFtcFv8_020193 [Champsocephalus gunnari]
MICSKMPSRMVAAPCGTCSIRKDHASPHQTPDQELLNLTAADTCVIFHSDWNPEYDLQAQAEREMLDKASLKLGLDHAVLQSVSGNKEGNNNGPVQQFSKKDIEDLLRKGAHAAIMDENDEGNRFCQEDIDQILQRRATIITITSV